MNKSVNFSSSIQLKTLVPGSLVLLLAACGGGQEESPARTAQLAGYSSSSGDMASASTAAPASPTGQEADQMQMPAQTAEPGAAGMADTAAQAAPVAAGAFDGSLPNAGAMAAIPATPYKLYVSPQGNDNNAGSASAPFRTLARAARATRPGTTVFVAPGTYTGAIKTTTHGTASARIYYVSTTKWGARIVPPSGSTVKTAWDNRGNYVSIIGFRVDGNGSRWTGGIYTGGSYTEIRGNWVHHIAKGVSCTSGGGSAIGVDSYYRGVQGDVIGNLVHDIGPAGCRYVQGIYVSTSGTVKNNVVYRVAEGAIHLWHDANNVIITNNTVVASNTGIIVGGGDYYFSRGPANNIHVYNNIVYDNKMGISEQGQTGTGNSYRNNLVARNSTYNWQLKNGLTHTATVSSEPLFVAYTRTGTPNLMLTSSSPAIGRGTPTHAFPVDFLERPRNTSTGFDIGAYQH